MKDLIASHLSTDTLILLLGFPFLPSPYLDHCGSKMKRGNSTVLFLSSEFCESPSPFLLSFLSLICSTPSLILTLFITNSSHPFLHSDLVGSPFPLTLSRSNPSQILFFFRTLNSLQSIPFAPLALVLSVSFFPSFTSLNRLMDASTTF